MSENTGGPLFTETVDDPLPGLARRIRDAHRRCEQAVRKSVAMAADLGQLLREAKGRVRHGEWVAWVRDHCPFGLRTAQCYMKIAEQLPGPKAQRVARLPLRAALAVLVEPQSDVGERKAIIDGLGVPSVKELVNAMGVDTDSHIRTAAETGWATDRHFLAKLTDEERDVFRQLPTGDYAKPKSEAAVFKALPAADARVSPVKRIGRRFNPKDRIGCELKRLRPMVLMETESGEVIPADANVFAMLRRRHKEAAVCYWSEKDLIVFQQDGEVVAALMPRCGAAGLGVEADPAESVRGRLADLRMQIDQLEQAAGSLGRIETVQVVLRLRKVSAELDALCPTPAKARKEASGEPARTRD